MDKIFPQHVMKIRQVFDDLNAEELDQTIGLLKRIGYRAENI